MGPRRRPWVKGPRAARSLDPFAHKLCSLLLVPWCISSWFTKLQLSANSQAWHHRWFDAKGKPEVRRDGDPGCEWNPESSVERKGRVRGDPNNVATIELCAHCAESASQPEIVGEISRKSPGRRYEDLIVPREAASWVGLILIGKQWKIVEGGAKDCVNIEANRLGCQPNCSTTASIAPEW